MATVVIGIHGLRNKPPKYLLCSWWKKAIAEGFEILTLPVPRFRFRMAYWAHHLHTAPQNPMIADCTHPRYLREPYVRGVRHGPRDPRAFGEKLRDGIHQQILHLVAGKRGFMNVDAVSDIILHRMFVELDIYYHQRLRDGSGRPCPAHELIREELAKLLRRHRHDTILLIAHSMGTIIAYDVLTHTAPHIPIHTFITLGSPLGFPVVMKKIRRESGWTEDMPLPTPASIHTRWINFADLDDVTCLNYNLRNHYAENRHGVRPFDQIVFNTYEHRGVANPHKAYGYLRTAEVTNALHHFLALENAGVWQRVRWVFSRPRF
jgi:hypothetical protein